MKTIKTILILLFVGIILFSGCSKQNNYEIINDYGRNINSMEEAKEIFEDIYYKKIEEIDNNSEIKEHIDLSLDEIKLTESGDYIFQWGGNCQILFYDGKLSNSYYCGFY